MSAATHAFEGGAHDVGACAPLEPDRSRDHGRSVSRGARALPRPRRLRLSRRALGAAATLNFLIPRLVPAMLPGRCSPPPRAYRAAAACMRWRSRTGISHEPLHSQSGKEPTTNPRARRPWARHLLGQRRTGRSTSSLATSLLDSWRWARRVSYQLQNRARSWAEPSPGGVAHAPGQRSYACVTFIRDSYFLVRARPGLHPLPSLDWFP